jgi:hypothetical protein
MQKLRGAVYLGDDAIEPWQLRADGRHEHVTDAESWHLLAMDTRGRVCGCLRYRQLSNQVSFETLGVNDSALASSPVWRGKLQHAIEEELAIARREQVAYVELGGWAIAPERRGTPEALRLALLAYTLAQALGGCRGITTATVRHRSATILRKIGGQPLEINGSKMPPYYDPQYRCEMEVLKFDSRRPEKLYARWLQELSLRLPEIQVVCNVRGASPSRLPRRHVHSRHFSTAWRIDETVPAVTLG